MATPFAGGSNILMLVQQSFKPSAPRYLRSQQPFFFGVGPFMRELDD